MANHLDDTTLESVKEYYGRVLTSSADLKTSACCSTEAMSPMLKSLVASLHPEVVSRFYGCGAPLPPLVTGCTVLDLGCGSGRDVYLLSKLVGEHGRVLGVDMTKAQLDVARRHQEFHRQAFGYRASNVEFHEGFIEDLEALGIAGNSVDVVVSNCVLNLSPDKRRVFSEIMRVLKPGGELYISDVFADRRVPTNLRQDPLLLGECLAGALYLEDFRRLLQQIGCHDYRVMTKSPILLQDQEVELKIGMINFASVTVRAFKLELEDRCEDFGQVAYYRGTIPEMPHAFRLDDHHLFRTGMPVPICSNTAAMLGETRFAAHFTLCGDTSTHFGLFACGPVPGPTMGDTAMQGAGSCC